MANFRRRAQPGPGGPGAGGAGMGMGGGSNMRNRSFDVSIIFRHPVFLITFLLAFVGWWTAFIGMCVAESDLHSINGGPAMGTLWFAIIFQLAIIGHLFIALARDSLPLHRFQIAIVTAVVVVFAINGVEMIYTGQQREGLSGSSALKAVGAGWLLIAMADLIWILYLTSEEDTFFYHLLNPTGLAGLTPYSAHRYRPAIGNSYGHEGAIGGGVPQSHNGHGHADYPRSNGVGVGVGGGGGYAADGYAPAPTSGGTPVKMTPVGGGGNVTGVGGGAPMLGGPVGGAGGGLGMGAAGAGAGDGMAGAGPQAKALYAYTASPDDPNEVSFAKGEILDVVDASGKWWQVRTSSNHVGIAPSNYLSLLN